MTGDVLIDDRLFAPAESTGSGPQRVNPILINDNVVDVIVEPAKKAGDPAVVSFKPPTRYLTMDCAGGIRAPARREGPGRGPGNRSPRVHRSGHGSRGP